MVYITTCDFCGKKIYMDYDGTIYDDPLYRYHHRCGKSHKTFDFIPITNFKHTTEVEHNSKKIEHELKEVLKI